MARQCHPGGHCSAGQHGGFLEGQVAWQNHDRFFIEDGRFCQHSVEIGAEPVGQVSGVISVRQTSADESNRQSGRQF
jgi:hypothetical protein